MILSLLLIFSGFSVPGWMILRLSGAPRHPAMVFLISAVAIYTGVIALDLGGWKITTTHLTIILFLISASAYLLSRIQNLKPISEKSDPPYHQKSSLPRWVYFFGGLLAVLILWKCLAQPMSGADTPFRWHLLPQLIQAVNHLEFYPPMNWQDYAYYFYPDGFAPFASSQIAWVYLVAGQPVPHLAGFIDVAIFAATLFLLADTARHKPALSKWLPVLALGYSGWFFWGVAIGQETGWTALCTAAMLWSWQKYSMDPQRRRLLLPILATTVGLLSREYGGIFLLTGTCIALYYRVGIKALFIYAVATGLLACPWYLRVWVETGNPFFNLSFFSIFPVNEAFRSHLQHVTADMHLMDAGWHAWLVLVWNFLKGSWLLCLGGLMALACQPIKCWPLVIALGILTALWLISVCYTSGGFVYSYRVMTPALVLLAFCWIQHPPDSIAGKPIFATAVVLYFLTQPFLFLSAPQSLRMLGLNRWLDTVTQVRTPGILAAPPSHLTPDGILNVCPSGNAYLHASHLYQGSAIRIVPHWAPELAPLSRHTSDPDQRRELEEQMNIRLLEITELPSVE